MKHLLYCDCRKNYAFVRILVFFLLCAIACRQTPPIPTLFTELPATATGITFANTLPEQTPAGMNIIQYLYYYNGGGVAAGDLNNDGLCDLYFASNIGPNKLYLNRSNFNFEDVTDRAGVAGTGSWKTGVSLADVNADGWLDIYVCQVGKYKSFSGKNQLFINNQDGTFTDQAAAYGLDIQAFSTQASFFDFDLDGDLDCFLVCHSVHAAGSYRDTTLTRKYDPLAADRLLLNPGRQPGGGPQPFIPAPGSGIFGGAAGYGLSLAIGDLNADGYPDAYVTNDFHENDYLYYNRKGRCFSESVATALGHTSNFSMGCDLADYNNDGLPDLLTLDMKPEDEAILKASQPADSYEVYNYKHSLGYHWQLPRNNLQLACPSPTGTGWSEVAQLAGVATTDWSWSALFADLDLDGWKDIYITNGIVRRPNDLDYLKFISSAEVQRNATDLQLIEKMPSGAVPNYGFRNRGDLTFEDVSKAWGLAHKGCSNGAAYADLDNDGDLDLITNNLNEPASVYRNNSSGANWLKVKFTANPADSANPFGIGARVTCWSNRQLQYFENQPVRGFESCVEPGMITIGLGKNTQADSLEVIWPGGQRQLLRYVAANQIVVVKKEAANDHPALPVSSIPAPLANKIAPTSADPPVPVSLDLIREKLMPWSLSTQGPKMAVGDVNGDGLEDYYVAGNQLFIQAANGSFKSRPAYTTAVDAGLETAAALFDADGDGDADLFIGMGGNVATGFSQLLCNDGQGNFVLYDQPIIPTIRENIACIRPADFDGDGDLDVFIGSRSVSGAYGLAPTSFLLENDGKGHFTDVTATRLGGPIGGLVTDAQWFDSDGDKRADLVICGEWMPLTIYQNTGKNFTKTEIPHSSGLWNCLSVADFDHDGDLDWIVGNLGLNSNLQASIAEPLGLWVHDFDKNGAFDPILTYYRQGKNYVFADKDLLLMQIPVLKKDFVQYEKYAHSTFAEVFPADRCEGAIHREAQILTSCYVENRGPGNWQLRPLPTAAQMSPVFAACSADFDGDGNLDVLLGGNLYEVQPSIGRFDASHGTLLQGDGKGNFTTLHATVSGIWLTGAVRDIQLIHSPKDRHTLVVSANNSPLQRFQLTQK